LNRFFIRSNRIVSWILIELVLSLPVTVHILVSIRISLMLNEKRAREKGIQFSVWTEQFSTNDRSLAEGEAGGMIKLLVDRKEKPIGIQILGLEAGNIISE